MKARKLTKLGRPLVVLAATLLIGCTPSGLMLPGSTFQKAPLPVSTADGGLVQNPNLVSNNAANLKASLAGLITSPSKLISNNAGGLISNNSGGLVSNNSGSLVSNNSGSYRIATLETSPVAQAVVYLTNLNEQFYPGPDGKALYTVTDAQGHYSFPKAPSNAPVIVTVLLPENRRLVGFLIPNDGGNTYNVSLATTIVTEFLRDQARLTGQTMDAFLQNRVQVLKDKLPELIQRTQALIDSGAIHVKTADTDPSTYIDLNVSNLPAMRHEYVRAFAASDKTLSDDWKAILGYRPLLIDEVDVGMPDGSQILSVTASDSIYAAAITSFDLRITKTASDSVTLVDAPRAAGIDYIGGMVASGSHLILGAAGQAEIEIDTAHADADSLLVNMATGAQGTHVVNWWNYDPSAAAGTDAANKFTAFDVTTGGGWAYLSSDKTNQVYRVRIGADGSLANSRLIAGLAVASQSATAPANPMDTLGAGGQVPLNYPTGVTYHEEGGHPYLYFADTLNQRIRRTQLDATGFPTQTILGRGTNTYGNIIQPMGEDSGIDDPVNGVAQTQASLAYPHKVAFSADGTMFVADTDHRRVRYLDNGKLKTLAGTVAGAPLVIGDSRRSGLGEVGSIAFDKDGNLLIADARASKLRRVRLPFGL